MQLGRGLDLHRDLDLGFDLGSKERIERVEDRLEVRHPFLEDSRQRCVESGLSQRQGVGGVREHLESTRGVPDLRPGQDRIADRFEQCPTILALPVGIRGDRLHRQGKEIVDRSGQLTAGHDHPGHRSRQAIQDPTPLSALLDPAAGAPTAACGRRAP